MSWLAALRLLHAAADPSGVAPFLTVSIPFGSSLIQADLFSPSRGNKHPAILLSHGFNQGGGREPRVIQLASGLRKIGFFVCVPSFPAAEELKVSPVTIHQMIAAFEWMNTRQNVEAKRSGIFGISYGATIGLIAAANCRIRHDVRFVVSLGGYASLENLLAYGRTGHYPKNGPLSSIPPDPYLSEILQRNPDADNLVHELSIKSNWVGSPGLNVILMHSESDPVVPWKEMLEIKKQLSGKVERIETFLIKLSGHARIEHWMSGFSAIRAARSIAKLRKLSLDP